MVKFAEAEKRGRGGEGGDRRLAPIMMLERPKISRGMWESLKCHIMKERRRKKEELEADAEEKRIRKERENRKKQHAMTLEETREQIVKADQKLNDLKAQKHELVQQLKKVLNEEKRRKDQEQQQHQQQQQQQQQQHQQQQQQLHHQQQQSTYMKDSDMVQAHPYSHGSLSIGGHPQMMFPSAMVQGRGGNMSTLYKVAVPTTQSLQNVIPAGTLKRSRSPSPQPSQSSYQQLPFVFKNLPGNQTSVVPVTLTSSKSPSATNVYLSSQPPGPYYHGANKAAHGAPGQYPSTTQAAVVAPYLTTPAGPPSLVTQASQGPPNSSRDDKHMQSIYLSGGRVPASHVSSLHPSLDHKGKPQLGGGNTGPYPPTSDGQDKFYVSGGRPHLVLHTGVLPVPQQPPNSAKGNISSGFPVRGPPQPPSTQGQSSASHSYSGHSINLSRNYF